MKIFLSKHVTLPITLALLSLNAFAQNGVQLTGTVLDKDTGKGISYCNVYLSGSSYGSQTDEKGQFTLTNLPVGSYSLIISHIGYTNLVKPLELKEGENDLGTVRLKEVSYDIDSEVLIQASEDRKWKSKFKKFSRFMMGYGFKAKNIDFVNAYIAEFSDKEPAFLRPQHDFNLEIENRHLGYKTNYLVTDFSIGGTLQFVIGYPSFTALQSKSAKEEKKWTNNRKMAYKGSLRHFFKSLLENTLEENEFLANITNLDPSVGLNHFDRVVSAANYNKPLNPIDQDDKFKIEPTDNERIMRITCKHTIEVYHLSTTDDSGEILQSYIKPVGDSFLVYTNGVLVDTRAVTLFGYFSQKGLYDMLPFDYEVSK
jgi:hypothetical protein